MFVMKMGEDKSLVKTVSSTLYQGDNNADVLMFIIPKVCNGQDVNKCLVRLHYVLPTGQEGRVSLRADSHDYNDVYYASSIRVSSILTQYSGHVMMWLTLENSDGSFFLNTDNSGIDVISRIPTEEMTPEEITNLDRLTLKVNKLEEESVDDLLFDGSENSLQLSANGKPIGGVVNLEDAWPDDGIIYFGENRQPSTSTES